MTNEEYAKIKDLLGATWALIGADASVYAKDQETIIESILDNCWLVASKRPGERHQEANAFLTQLMDTRGYTYVFDGIVKRSNFCN